MENLNYLQIVLEGYQDINTRNFLKNYFIRKWKKAEENHYSVDEFFVGLRKVITIFEEDIKLRKAKRANELYTLINMNEGDDVKVKEFKDEIQWMRENDSHYAFINGYGNLSGTQVLFIKNAILLAYGEVLPKEKPMKENPLPKFEDFILPFNETKGEKLKKELKIMVGKNQRKEIALKIYDAKIEGIITLGSKDLKRFVRTFWTKELEENDYNNILTNYNLLK